MGRRDIVEFLLDRGARIDIFCAAMMGRLDAVKSFLTLQPRLIDARGPHGFTLHFHAQVGGKDVGERAGLPPVGQEDRAEAEPVPQGSASIPVDPTSPTEATNRETARAKARAVVWIEDPLLALAAAAKKHHHSESEGYDRVVAAGPLCGPTPDDVQQGELGVAWIDDDVRGALPVLNLSRAVLNPVTEVSTLSGLVVFIQLIDAIEGEERVDGAAVE